jgi:hypothetical protein
MFFDFSQEMGVFLLILWTAVAAQRFVLPGGPRQRVLGVFSPKTVGCGVIVTTSQVLHYVVNANSTLSYVARYAVSNVMANPNRQVMFSFFLAGLFFDWLWRGFLRCCVGSQRRSFDACGGR